MCLLKTRLLPNKLAFSAMPTTFSVAIWAQCAFLVFCWMLWSMKFSRQYPSRKTNLCWKCLPSLLNWRTTTSFPLQPSLWRIPIKVSSVAPPWWTCIKKFLRLPVTSIRSPHVYKSNYRPWYFRWKASIYQQSVWSTRPPVLFLRSKNKLCSVHWNMLFQNEQIPTHDRPVAFLVVDLVVASATVSIRTGYIFHATSLALCSFTIRSFFL